MNMELIHKYFPLLSPAQQEQFRLLGSLYPEWNARINVISRKDIENLYERHILHSLAVAKVIRFKTGTRVLDAGTGGGFPGIPLAILFPGTHFHLVDSTAKKLSVVEAIAASAGLTNISTEHCRFEDHVKKYDFVVSRAVATLDLMVAKLWKNILIKGSNELPNGILYLKGGDLAGELAGLEEKRRGKGEVGKWGISNYKVYALSDYFDEDFFETKSLVHLF